jgi:hypothetical protein
MERGVYFDAWFPRQHCYHPSLPPRRLRMIEDLQEYRATSLVWAALGGGSISLPYLEQEAFQKIDPRFRFYGFLNDREFIEHCQAQGIKVFGIVFEVQGWEFPVELSEDEDEILSMNEPRGVGRRGWIGLREFTQNRYPKLWKPFEHYFPAGLVNSDGEKVTNLLEQCVSRDIHGAPMHSVWVEAPDRDHYAYLMDTIHVVQEVCVPTAVTCTFLSASSLSRVSLGSAVGIAEVKLVPSVSLPLTCPSEPISTERTLPCSTFCTNVV